MDIYQILFNFFYFIGVCPFSLERNNKKLSGEIPNLQLLVILCKTILCLTVYMYEMFRTAVPKGGGISFATSLIAVGTTLFDFSALQVLQIMTYKAHFGVLEEFKKICERINHLLLIRKPNIIRSRWILPEVVVKTLYLSILPIALKGNFVAAAIFFVPILHVIFDMSCLILQGSKLAIRAEIIRNALATRIRNSKPHPAVSHQRPIYDLFLKA